MTWIKEARAACAGAIEGYDAFSEVWPEGDVFLIVENPKYQPDDGSNPRLVANITRALDALEKAEDLAKILSERVNFPEDAEVQDAIAAFRKAMK